MGGEGKVLEARGGGLGGALAGVDGGADDGGVGGVQGREVHELAGGEGQAVREHDELPSDVVGAGGGGGAAGEVVGEVGDEGVGPGLVAGVGRLRPGRAPEAGGLVPVTLGRARGGRGGEGAEGRLPGRGPLGRDPAEAAGGRGAVEDGGDPGGVAAVVAYHYRCL